MMNKNDQLQEICQSEKITPQEVDQLIADGAEDLVYGLMGAAEGGRKDLFDHILNHERVNVNWPTEAYPLFLAACRGGNLEIVNQIIGEADPPPRPYWWEEGVREADENGHGGIVEDMIARGANPPPGKVRKAIGALLETVVDHLPK